MIMNYTLYLQQGGSAQPSIEEQIAQLVQAAMSGDQLANDQINQIMQAAEQGDQKALQLALLIQQVAQKLQAEQPEAMKCGGKVRAKVKKACGGKKMEKGGEAPIKKEAKGGKPCPCTLHKVGGRLIEVDCNGIPVAKEGAILYAKPGNQIPPSEANDAVKRYMTAKPITNAMIFSDQWFGDLGRAFVRKTNSWEQQLQQKNPDFWNTPTPVKKEVVNEPKIGSPEWKTQQLRNQEAFAQTQEGLAALQRADRAITQRQEAAQRALEEAARAAASTQQTTWRDTFGAGKAGKFGGLTYDEAIARQKEMAAAQGFNANFGRQDGMWGQKSKAEWERYQAWKQQQADLAQRKADREAAGTLLSRPAVQAQTVQQSVLPQTLGYDKMGANERFIKQGYTSGRPWTDAEIKNMDPAQALYLNDEDYRRYLGKTFTNTLQPPMYAYNAGGYNIPDYSAFFRKQGGSLNYAQYLNLK